VIRTLVGAVSAAAAGAACLGRKSSRDRLQRTAASLRRDLERAAEEIGEDVRAVQERDPAATSRLEILTSYPGLHALWLHRLTHRLYQLGVPIVPRWLSQTNRFLTGIEIHPAARIGRGLFIDHGAGVVIGETAEIGRNVTIYQGVTLGGTGKQTGKRHPTVGDNVVFGAGAKVLGAIRVGDNAKVGAGSVVVADVPDDSTVVGNPGRPVLLEGQRVGIPDIDYRHLPDPVAEAVQHLVARIVEVELELEALNPEGAEGRRAAMAATEQRIGALLQFRDGSGI
jgi:serine O-acetyltransferase